MDPFPPPHPPVRDSLTVPSRQVNYLPITKDITKGHFFLNLGNKQILKL